MNLKKLCNGPVVIGGLELIKIEDELPLLIQLTRKHSSATKSICVSQGVIYGANSNNTTIEFVYGIHWCKSLGIP